VEDVFSTELKADERPAFVAVVDVSGSEELVEVARAGILALIEALPPSALFGLVTVSSTVGVFDMRSAFPHCYNIPIPDEGEMPTGVMDVLPADCMMVQIASHKDNIAAAIETLTSTTSTLPANVPRKNGFGACMDSLLESFETTPDYSVRFITVMGSMPNYGLGALTAPPQVVAGADSAAARKPPKGAEEYVKMVERIKSISAVVDLFVIAEEGFIGVEALLPLVQCAGGALVYYPGLDTSALPQDLYRIYARPFASNAILRLRCSSGFTVSRGYGHMTADDQFENLYHVSSCHSESCFAVDLEFDSPSGVTTNLDVQPTLQLAFSYTCVVPIPDSTAYQVQRRLRLETVRIDMARMPLDLYAAADAEVIGALLSHKIIQSMTTDGLGEARLLLQDWLAILASRYNENMMRRREVTLDVSFSKHTNMGFLPRLVYGMLRGRLLDPVLVSRDERAFVCYLCSSLNPEALTLICYPKLEAFASVHESQSVDTSCGLPLSIKSLNEGGGTIYILDAYTELSVFYTKPAVEQSAFPPPPDSALRSYIQQVKENRAICPHVYYSKAGDASSSEFYGRLIEDAASSMGVGAQGDGKEWSGAASKGYATFLDVLRAEVKDFMADS